MSPYGYNDGFLLCLIEYEFPFPGVCLWRSVATATSWSSTPHLWLESRPSWEWYVNVSDQCTKYDEKRWRLNTKLKQRDSTKKTTWFILTCDGKADPLERGIFCWMLNRKNYEHKKLFWETFKTISPVFLLSPRVVYFAGWSIRKIMDMKDWKLYRCWTNAGKGPFLVAGA